MFHMQDNAIHSHTKTDKTDQHGMKKATDHNAKQQKDLATEMSGTDFGGSRVGFALGSSRPVPAGLVSASCSEISSSSISTLPCNRNNSHPQR